MIRVYKIILALLISTLSMHDGIAQKSFFEADFIQLDVFAKQADYKAGLFYSKKICAAVTKSKSAKNIDLLRSNCYVALFADRLDKSIDVAIARTEIEKHISALSDTANLNSIAETYGVFCDFYFNRGIYTQADSIYASIKNSIALLPPYERERIRFCQYNALFHKGYLNKIIAEVNVDKVRETLPVTKDSIFDGSNKIIFSELNENEKSIRENLLSDFILLKANAYLLNGLSDSAIVYLQKNEAYITNREGNKAHYRYVLAQCYLSNLEYRLAEKEFKNASALAQHFFQPHAPIQVGIQQGLIYSLIQQGKIEEATYYKNDLVVRLYSYYNKDNIAYLINTQTEIDYEMALRNWTKAEALASDFLAKKALPTIHILRKNYLSTLLTIQINQRKYAEAEKTIDELLEQQKQLTGMQSPAYQIVWMRKARFYSYNLDKYKEAKAIYSSVLDSDFQNQISIENPDYYLNTLDFSTVFIYTEEFSMADNRLILNLKRIEKTYSTTHTLYAIYLSHQGELKTIRGDFSGATIDLSSSLAIFEKNNKKKYTHAYIEALQLYLKLNVLEGDYSKAEATLEKAKTIAKKASISESSDLFLVEEIGLLYVKKGEYQKGNKILSSILRSQEERVGEDHKSISSTLNYLGEQNLITGNYAEADAYFKRSAEITKHTYGNQSIPYATSLQYYKKLYTAIGDYEQAESTIKEVLIIYSRTYGDKNIKTGIIMHEAALATFQSKQYTNPSNKTYYSDLDKQFLKSLEIIKQTEDDNSIFYAEALEDYALFLASTDNNTGALEKIEKAKKIWSNKFGENNIHTANLNIMSGKIFYHATKYEEALHSFELAKNQFKNIFDDNHPGYVVALGSCAQMYYILGNTTKSIESIEECTNKSLVYIDKVFPFLSERGKIAYWDKIKDDFEFYKTVAFVHAAEKPEMIGKILNIQLQTKSILLNSQLKIKNKIYGSGDTTAIRLYQEWLDTRDNLAVAYSLNAAQRKEENIDIVVLESKLETVEKSLSMYSDYFSSQTKNKAIQYTWKSLKQNLSENELAIETIPFRLFTKSFSDTIYYGFVAVANNSTTPSYVIEKNGKNLEERNLSFYRNMIKFNHIDTLSYNAYWKLISILIKPNYSTIYFAADGVYSQLNVETLRDPNGQFLINSSNIQYIGSTRDIITKNIKETKSEKNPATQSKEIDLIGNPTYYAYKNDGMIDQLPGSEKEVRSINSIVSKNNWKTNIFIGSDATEDTVKAIRNPYVLHLSTHGFFWQENATHIQNDLTESSISNPLLMSGILLYNGGELINTKNINTINKSPGILTAYEAMNLSLDKTDLVVLSACETGLGEIKVGEGVYGLQRSFTVAGAKTIIMSLSKVSDEVTTKLMEKFYTNWLETGNKREAFIQAKKDLMIEYPEPKYWGAFILIGI